MMIKKIIGKKNYTLLFCTSLCFMLLIAFIIIHALKNKFPFYFNTQLVFLKDVHSYRTIWIYWENKPNSSKPPYISLCHQTILKNSTNFKVHLLDEKSVYNFLPNLRQEVNLLSIPQKADYIRLLLLKQFGGIWFDSDTILLQNPQIIIDKLKHYDFAGFGCHQSYCKKLAYGYPKPANWVMASRKNSKLVINCLVQADDLLDKYPSHYFNKPENYHIFGRKLLWFNIEKLLFTNWDYYHFPSFCLDRDSKNSKLTNDRYISKEKIDLKCVDKMIFTPFYSTSPGFPEWFKNMNEETILKEEMLVSKLFRKALGLENNK